MLNSFLSFYNVRDRMKNTANLTFLLLLTLLAGWGMMTADLPFTQVDIILAAVSLIVMSLLPNRFVFVYLVAAVLGYGGFLTAYAFLNNQTGPIQYEYIYDHLLFTAFLLVFWVLTYLVKSISQENSSLKLQVARMEKLDKDTSILTPQEFIYQAKYILSDVKRNRGEAWLVELDLLTLSEYTQESLQDYLEAIVLASVRIQFDIVTATENKIYMILKNTDETGLLVVLGRIEEKQRELLNLIDKPYELVSQPFDDERLLSKIEEELQ